MRLQLTAGELAVVPATANRSNDDVFAIRFAMQKSDGVLALLVSNDKFRCARFAAQPTRQRWLTLRCGRDHRGGDREMDQFLKGSLVPFLIVTADPTNPYDFVPDPDAMRRW